jgi:hypothetical protein
MFLKSSLQEIALVRTKGQQSFRSGDTPMIQDAQDTLRRAYPTLAQDFLGAAALVAMLLIGLHLPGLF